MKHKMSGELDYTQYQQDELPYTCSDIVSTKYEFYIDQDILEPSYYRNLITVLNNATENDLVILNINSQGGSLDSAISIMQALRDTRAETIAHTVGSCYSAATLLALSCNNVDVGEFSNWMIHDGSYAVASKSSDIVTRASFENKFIRSIFKSVYIPFISEQEMDDVMRGVDLWMTSDEVRERFESMRELQEQEFLDEINGFEEESDEDCDNDQPEIKVVKKKKILPS